MVVEIMRGCDEGGRRIMKKDQNVRAPPGVVYDNDRTRRGGETECVERWRCQKGVQARQGLNLRNELITFLQKLALLQQETTEWVDRPEVVGRAIINA